MRGWNDPYLIGPFLPGQKGLIHVMNIGETGKSWHLHGHHWYRLQQIWHPWQGYPEWHQTVDSEPGPGGFKAKPFDPVPFTPAMELAHTRWISPGEIMPIFIQAGNPGMWFGHDHVVPQAYIGMVPWLVVKAPGGTPEAAKQDAVIKQMQDEHLRLIQHANEKQTLPSMEKMHAMGAMGSAHPNGSPNSMASMHH
jgi:hypothetical protein